ncbi:MAG: M15 family metallopeptidase [Clostridia bacterium]|nr:M15 family metallopeptidase [Clostridia bacterium]
MKRIGIFVFILLACCCAAMAEQPEWTYPLPPEILANNEGYITLANKEVLLDADYAPQDLEKLAVRNVVDDPVRKAVNDALVTMFADAEENGYKLYVKSAYRSYQTQHTMYFNRLEKNNGKDDGWVSYPGASDHQTGLGIDVLNYAWTKKEGMNEKFALEDEAKWMAENCWDYGFVIRYMEDKEEITQINYEPWHLRYVGPEVAKYMQEMHYCLEEFTQEWQAYIEEYEANGGDFNQLLKERAAIEATVIGYSEDGEEEVSLSHNFY